jgi:hypothetical protein
MLDEREMYWIKKYDSHKNGLNQTDGGAGSVGFFRTKEYKENLSKICKELGINKKPITQYSLDGEKLRNWSGAIEVYNELGYDFSSIGKVCNGKTIQAYGYVWRYKDDEFSKYTNKYKNREVVQFDMNNKKIAIYQNVRKASISTGIAYHKIEYFCKNKSKNGEGFIWKFLDNV